MNTFNHNLKDRLLKTGGSEKDCCKTACLSAVILTSGSLVITKDGINIELSSDNDKLYLKITELVKSVGNIEIHKKTSEAFGKASITAVIAAPDAEKVLLSCLILNKDDDSNLTVVQNIDSELFKDKCCVASFIKGAVIGCGYCLIPKDALEKSNGYLMEWVFERENIAMDFAALLNGLRLAPKVLKRKEKTVIYLKNSEQICDVLALAGAGKAVLDIREQKAARDMRNRIQRETNCISRNIKKSVEASEKVLKAIEKLEKESKLDELPVKLKTAAKLRKENPHLALDELAALSAEPISKSGLRHRLDKIIEISGI